MRLLALYLLFSTAAASFAHAQSHSGDVGGGQHGSVLNSHSSDGNTSAAAHAGQRADLNASDTDKSRSVAMAGFPSFSDRGECGGNEGSAQAGAAGAFFGLSFGSSSTEDCEVRKNIATLAEMATSGLIPWAEARLMIRKALTGLKGFDSYEYVTTNEGGVRLTVLRPKAVAAPAKRLSVLERREAANW